VIVVPKPWLSAQCQRITTRHHDLRFCLSLAVAYGFRSQSCLGQEMSHEFTALLKCGAAGDDDAVFSSRPTQVRQPRRRGRILGADAVWADQPRTAASRLSALPFCQAVTNRLFLLLLACSFLVAHPHRRPRPHVGEEFFKAAPPISLGPGWSGSRPAALWR
jgi:hypothetical protein